MALVTRPASAGAPLLQPHKGRACGKLGLSWLCGYPRYTVLGACIAVFAALLAHADEAPQGWVPEDLGLPGDMEILTDRAIGSTIRMFSFTTSRAADELLVEWEQSLREGGYAILQSQGDSLDSAIEFSGQGIVNAKIVVMPSSDPGLSVVAFDATLE